jgi:hypothetical protein
MTTPRLDVRKWVVIATDGSRLFWSVTIGWVNLADATQFDAEHLLTMNLPVGGAWMPMSNV